MRKRLGIAGLLVVGLFVSGCATDSWQKAGVTNEQLSKDVAECADKAQLPAVTPGQAPVAGSIMPYSYELQKVYNKCMTDRGYKM